MQAAIWLKPDSSVCFAGPLGPSHQGVGEQALVAAVLGTGAARQQLVPALMKAYAAADFVVGLDVDKDQFDKFSMRNCIDMILLELWKDPGGRVDFLSLIVALLTLPITVNVCPMTFWEHAGCALINAVTTRCQNMHLGHQSEKKRASRLNPTHAKEKSASSV